MTDNKWILSSKGSRATNHGCVKCTKSTATAAKLTRVIMALGCAAALNTGSGQAVLASDSVQFGIEQRLSGDAAGASTAIWVDAFGKPAIRLESTRNNRVATEIKFTPTVIKNVTFSFKKAVKDSPDPVLRVEYRYGPTATYCGTFRLNQMTVTDTPGDWKAAVTDISNSYLGGYTFQRAAVVAVGQSEGLLDLHRAEFTVAAFQIDGQLADQINLTVRRETEQDPIINNFPK